MSFTATIVGRPNVGKSTLFNRLVGKKLALVDDTPGLTRDRREGQAKTQGLSFRIIDTAGLEEAETNSLQELMMAQTYAAMEEADIILFVIDAREGMLPIDRYFADLARKSGKPSILLANKAEGNKVHPETYAAGKLGLGSPVLISAEHADGLDRMVEAIESLCEKQGIEIIDEEAQKEREETIHLALAGRPNVGKSTLFNCLLKEERAIVSPIAGTTRDAVTVDWEFDNQKIKLVDTAGLRKKAKRKQDYLEKISVDDSFRAIQYANVVVLMIDGTQPLEKVEKQIGKHILDEGRAMIIAVNKWDLVENKKEMLDHINNMIDYDLAQARGVTVVTISALNKQGVKHLMKAVLEVYELWNKRVSTAQLNKWLDIATAEHLPPLAQGKRIRLKYITQIKTRPPTFAVFTSSRIKDLPESYVRYLINSLRESLGFEGAPIRFLLRKSKNPYGEK